MGKKHRTKKDPCPKGCGGRFAAGPMVAHLKSCGRNTPPPSQTYTLSPDEDVWPNSEIRCVLCGGQAPMIAHPVTKKLFASCAKWYDPRHRDRDAARRARNDSKAARSALGGHSMIQARGDQIIEWRARIESLNGSRLDELVAFTSENQDWRTDDNRSVLLEALARRVEITDKEGYYSRLETRLGEVDPADVPKLWGGTNYREVCQSVQTLVRCPRGDPMFGRLPPLTTLLTFGTVESSLLALVDKEVRRIRASMRKAASGAASRHVVRERSRLSTNVRGLLIFDVNRRSAGVQTTSALAQRRRWRDGPNGFGLRLKAEGVGLLAQCLPRQLRVASPRAVKNLDCDFGGVANNQPIYQGPNVKLDGEGLVGDATTREYSRPANVGIARVLQTLSSGDHVVLQVCCFGEEVVEYPTDGGTWRDDFGRAAVHFLATYDAGVYDKHVAPNPREWARNWTRHLLEEDGCGGVIYGRPCSLVVNGETYGRCPYTDPLFCLLANSLDRTVCRVALDLDYRWDRDQPRDDTSVLPAWAGNRDWREALLRAATPHADDALRIAEVEILPRVAAAFADEDGDPCAALREGYAAVALGAETMGPGPYLAGVRQRYVDTVAPTVLEELGRARRFVIETYNVHDLDAGPVSTRYRFEPRTGLDDLLGAPDTSRLPPVPRASSPGRGGVDALTSALAASPSNFQASSDDDDAALPEVPKSRTRRRRRARRRRPPDGSTQPDSTARSLGAGGLPPVL
ncbi:unnamed protein product [Pelagomonas calceolata]|uniref:Uncharacterized protein n=2 Tax=Pelagomonas calceolata TaxID=35677 RepID=A0A8J2X0E4_9STRA|nr:unnamed protein product [Pelagomonas calceolata]